MTSDCREDGYPAFDKQNDAAPSLALETIKDKGERNTTLYKHSLILASFVTQTIKQGDVNEKLERGTWVLCNMPLHVIAPQLL
jgi:hypothetical protein